MSDANITAECECGKTLRLLAEYAGKTVSCPQCERQVLVPGGSPPPRRRAARPAFDDDDFVDDGAHASAALANRRRAPTSRKPRARKWSPATIVLVIVGGGVFVLFATCAGLAYVGFGKLKDASIYANQPDFGDPTSLFPIDQIPAPASFSNVQISRREGISPGGLPGRTEYYTVTMQPDGEDNAGLAMSLRIYMPGGEHEAGSLPCVLIAPARTNLMVGNRLDDGSYHDETLPYAKAGMVAVTYSLDGACDLQSATDQQLRRAYLEFRAAAAGVVNGRNALEYVLQKVPEVDPNRIYCAGHSSAGTVSLLLAAHEPRISGCIAYAPAADVEAELAEILKDAGASLLLPRLADFLKQSNPMTHLNRIKCPVFLFHARDDSNTPFHRTNTFAVQAKAAGVQVTFSPVDRGGHYQSMIDQGIPLGVQWLQSL